MRKILTLLATSSTLLLHAQTTVWSTDVAPILYNNCVSCHRPDGIAPFSLLTYADAVAQGGPVSGAVQSKHMPPWPPDPEYKRLAHERVLTQAEIGKISDWVSGGMPQGDPNLAPPLPVFSNTGELPGVPDLVTKIPAFTSTASTGDVYQCFVIPSGMMADKYIAAFEAIPGNRSIVHHVLVYEDQTGTCAALDAASPGPGYVSFGGVGNSNAKLLGGWVPGTQPLKYPDGFGVKLSANSDIVVQVHYPVGSAGQVDSTEIHFFFANTPTVRDVSIVPALNHSTNMVNGPLFIPAGQTRTFVEKQGLPGIDLTMLGIAPHMHNIGTSIRSFGVKNNGDTMPFISIPDWHFHWQGFYAYPKLQKIPGGSTVYAEATYDNTTNNENNPSNPPQDVSLGESTTDEMMLVYFIYTTYQAGDENIVMDSSITTSIAQPYYHGAQLLDPYPNPAVEELVVKYYLQQSCIGSLQLVDLSGKTVRNLFSDQKLSEGYHVERLNVSALASGTYLLRLIAGEQVSTRKVIIK